MPGRLIGEVVDLPLDSVVPNAWNPNRMTDQLKASLKHGLEHTGWLKSQALLIWGSDEEGETKNIIIDGEHRWTAATELGFEDGPMVILDRMTERDAKSLTVQMNQKRGDFHLGLLSDLLADLKEGDTSHEALGLELGFDVSYLDRLLDGNGDPLANLGAAPVVTPPSTVVAPGARDGEQTGSTQVVFTVTIMEKATIMDALAAVSQQTVGSGSEQLKPSHALVNLCRETLEALGQS